MKTFMITAALTVLSLGHVVEAQDGKSTRTKAQITEQLLGSLPTQDIYTSPVLVFSAYDQHLISMLPILDEKIEMPNLIKETTTVANTTTVAPATHKTEVKASSQLQRIGDK